MIAQITSEEGLCPHCLGQKICDCVSCGQKVWYISFGGKRYQYYESEMCRVCKGKGFLSEKS